MHPVARRTVVLLLATALAYLSIGWGAEKTSLLMMAKWNRVDNLRKFFDGDPCIEYSIVVTQDDRVPDAELARLIRLYFPRTYQDLRNIEVAIIERGDILSVEPDGRVTFLMTVKGNVAVAINADQVRDRVTGLSVSAAQRRLESELLLDPTRPPRIRVWPPWFNRLPVLPVRITVDVTIP